MPRSGLATTESTGQVVERLPSAPTERDPMSDAINRHDARALALIDHALNEAGFTAEIVEQIREALASASAESDSSIAA